MKYLDLTLPTPAENLACDEALLDGCEDGHCPEELLRVWEPQRPFVVVGYANKVATEVNLPACEARDIPVLRRCSGGGTVLQGPGCLNFALVLKITGTGPLHSIASANRFIMDRNRTALESVLQRRCRSGEAQNFNCEIRHPKSEVTVRGHTDLAVGSLKFSGNSQRRRRNFLLFHGSFLLQADLALISELLPMPSKQPDYRGNRSHQDFLTNLPATADEVKAALLRAWNAEEPFNHPPLEAAAALAREKYATPEWNHMR